MRRNIALASLVVAAALVLFVAYQNSMRKNIPLVFSPRQMLEALWSSYKRDYVEAGSNRTLDKQRDNMTTSEGQAYTMLRSAWLGDKDMFDRSLQWTNQYLDRREDNLFAWAYGNTGGESWGVLTESGGYNSASDGDTDIALSLLFAYARWQDERYLTQAKSIITDIWEKEVITIRGTPYLTSNNLEKDSDKDYVIVNPSYLSPYAYRVFAKVDPEHPWDDLVDSSYALIGQVSRAPLDTKTSAGLPPDWVRIDKKTGAVAAVGGNLSTDFSYDAFRTYFRVALDWQWSGDPRAKEMLESATFLTDYLRTENKLPASFRHDGSVANGAESPAVYGGIIGAVAARDPALAKDLYEQKLVFLYDPGTNDWKKTPGYYDSNWVWFGIALYNGLLPDLTGLTATSTPTS